MSETRFKPFEKDAATNTILHGKRRREGFEQDQSEEKESKAKQPRVDAGIDFFDPSQSLVPYSTKADEAQAVRNLMMNGMRSQLQYLFYSPEYDMWVFIIEPEQIQSKSKKINPHTKNLVESLNRRLYSIDKNWHFRSRGNVVFLTELFETDVLKNRLKLVTNGEDIFSIFKISKFIFEIFLIDELKKILEIPARYKRKYINELSYIANNFDLMHFIRLSPGAKKSKSEGEKSNYKPPVPLFGKPAVMELSEKQEEYKEEAGLDEYEGEAGSDEYEDEEESEECKEEADSAGSLSLSSDQQPLAAVPVQTSMSGTIGAVTLAALKVLTGTGFLHFLPPLRASDKENIPPVQKKMG